MNIALIAHDNKKELLITDFKDFCIPEISQEERKYQELWKTFVKAISIETRKNLKVQKQFMPRRYWKNMLEMEEEWKM